MIARERLKGSTRHDYSRAVFTGNLAILQEFLLKQESVFWSILRLFDFLLRGFGQVAFANNPISGLLIAIALAVTASGTLIFSAITGFLGLLLSVLIRDRQENVANGVTVLNPLLVGAVSYALIPKFYGSFDAFSILLVILGTIFSVYLSRSLGNSKSPCLAWPFNLTEFALLLVLYNQDNGVHTTEKLQPLIRMVFQGIVLSASQVFAVESVVTGSIVYLATLLFSPTTAGFAFLGALIGSLAGLMLGVEIEEIYAGLWGYNAFLTGASLGGTLFVLNKQTGFATIVAIVFTVIVQYSVLFFFRDLKLPVLTLPFVLATTLFLKLRNNLSDKTFPQPTSISFPEKQRWDYYANQQMLTQKVFDGVNGESGAEDGHAISEFNV
ncbi:unnamed protein product [Xylocopa violacea]|uniref:Urea transporter n=1 Tax=Xylocopa violacea TaxID=135666 RepID=A0ABP1N8Y9_XYLVO